MGPNMSVLKTNAEPNAQTAIGAANAGVLYYEMSEHHANHSASSSASNNANNTSATSTSSRVNSATSSSFRGGSGSAGLTSENTLSTGGSLKKDQLMSGVKLSAAGEGKAEKEAVKQQIPVKLSSKLSVSGGGSGGGGSLLKEKSSKKMSSVVSLGKVSARNRLCKFFQWTLVRVSRLEFRIFSPILLVCRFSWCRFNY